MIIENYYNNFKKSDLDNLNWELYLGVNKNKSSNIQIDSTEKYLLKTKFRRGCKLRKEARNLNKLIPIFNNTKIIIPKPYYSGEKKLIMDYIPGIDLSYLLDSGFSNVSEKKVFNLINSLLEIKIKENIYHNDFNFRHILVGKNISLIDVENLNINSKYSDLIKKENDLFVNILCEKYPQYSKYF